MNLNKMVYGIDILDYEEMDVKDSHRWLIETKCSPKELDEITSELINKKGRFARVSAESLALELEKLKYFKIIEDLTGVIQYTSEYEI
ncbi:MAG: hypothetical protein ACQEP5_09985 [Actinomycetota bacterium]